MIFNHPLALWLLPLALLPILLERSNSKSYSWTDMLPNDPLSNIVGLLLKVLASIALASIIFGLAGPHSLEEKVERTGIGAQIAMVLDRSASMDDPFAGGLQDGRVGETKSVAASRLMVKFVLARKNDMIGLITFSNSAMYVLPLTESRDAVLAAIRATAGNSLLDWLQRYNISLYWIILKKPNSRSLFDEYIRPDDQALPAEIELHNYFKTLRTPFQVYEAEDPKSLASAISDINQKEKKPIKYFEKIPGRDFTALCYWVAILMIALLLSVKYLEVRTWRSA